MQELFVYYRVRTGDETVALEIVKRFQAALRRDHPHLSARLLRRSDSSQAFETWMEVYAADPALGPEGVGPALQRTIETAAKVLMPHIDGVRHAEVFVDSGHGDRRG